MELITKNLGYEFDDCVELVGERPSKDHRYLMDSRKSNTELSWVAEYSLETGLKETIRWFSDKLSELSNIPLEYVHKP